jgi:hypothetical protein
MAMTRQRARYIRKLANKVTKALRSKLAGPARRSRKGATIFVPRCKCGTIISEKVFSQGDGKCFTCRGEVRTK